MTAGLVWFHRWLGVATCVVFALWFASGAVLLFKPFPSLSKDESVEMLAPLDTASLKVSPKTAIDVSGMKAVGLRLIQRAGRPTYIVEGGPRSVAVDGQTGRMLPPLGRLAVGAQSAAIDYDQWVVHNQFDPFRPLYRMPSTTTPGAEIYISAITGETVQRTTMSDRAWNWVGAVLHWVYFTPIRSSFTLWDRSVWTLSLVATLVAISGTILGVIRTLTALRQRKPSLTYFRLRWLRWHHLLGIFVAVFVVSWMVSGWLSMDHGRLFSRGMATPEEQLAYQGGTYEAGISTVKPTDLARLSGTREIGFTVVDGQAVLTVYEAGGRVRRLDSRGHVLDDERLDRFVGAGIMRAWPQARVASITAVQPFDTYALAEGWPATARHVSTGQNAPDIYFDGRTGQLLTVMNASRESYEWAYYALHTFNFPGLASRPALRQTIVMILMIAGLAFSLTGVVIGWKRLRK